jgi:nucleoside-diphosphate-sugar epimerase
VSRFLIIGGTGFIGRHICEALADLPGATVVTTSNVAAGSGSVAGAAGAAGAADIVLDLTAGRAEVAAVIAAERPDVVVNCAGLALGDPADLAAVNIDGVAALVGVLLAERPSVRLIHLGSSAEYGAVPVATSVREDDPARPLGVYGVTKLAGTRLVELAGQAGVDALVLRLFNPVGPGAPPANLAGRVVRQLIEATAAGGPVRTGPLGDHRDFVDVRDVAAAVRAAATHPDRFPVRILNVGSGTAATARQVVHGLAEEAGFGGGIEEAAPGDDGAGSPRSAGVRWQRADIGAIATTLGWAPRIDLRTSLRDLWHGAACPA